MAFWTRLWGGAASGAGRDDRQSYGADMYRTEKAAGHAAGSSFRPVTPASAAATPHRYGALAHEGYGRNVIVFRAISLVARALSSLPLCLRSGGQVLDAHPVLDLLAAPNPRHDRSQLIADLASAYLIAGNAFLLKVGDSSAPPRELWPVRPDTVTVMPGEDGTVAAFVHTVSGRKQEIAPRHMMHWRTYNPLSQWVGLAPLSAAATAVDAHNAGSRWNLALIQNGGAPSGVLYQDDGDHPLTPEQFQDLKAQVDAGHTGPEAAGRPLLLEGGLKWQAMGMSPKDMDWQDGQHMSAREIALAFGVPPQMMGIPDSQTYSNYAEARLSLWEDTVIPMGRELVSALNSWLLPDFGPGLQLDLQLDDVPALEPKRQRRFERIAAADFLSDAEKRETLGFAPVQKQE